jgi:16S rRNA (guanine966-N2)-methyltransferase
MRVIAGKARRLPLKTVPGLDTRPTTDRIKETLFNILQDDLYNIRFLDLFGGSGGIGIEALSRGAREAVFVDQGKAAAQCIRENLAFTHLEEDATVLQCDVLSALSRLEGQAPFGIIFMDPPYGQGLERRVLEYFAFHRPSYVTPDTIIIVEEAKGMDYSYAKELGFTVTRVKEYKTNMHIFLTMQEQETL